ncbi:MAG: Membrane fusion component of MSF-type tripartite multidrug efflux system [Pseudolabrys sp.]|jgi:membrane fusion protein (multidrug efflux system)|nr:Membrane fusion component of MSF-type tripartite multidrug efflux system [Pseudolabrys sp.]
MLQRAKTGPKSGDISRLSLVPISAEQAKEIHSSSSISAEPGPVEARIVEPGPAEPTEAEPVQDRAPNTPAPSAKVKLGGALKANRKRVLQGVGVLALIGVAWFGYDYLTVGRYIVSTDDAYVHADATTLAAKVSGYIASIDAADNKFVHAGEVIARIDNGDYKLALESARDKVATQQATVERIGRQIPAQEALVDQARAQLVSAQAAETRAQSELVRQKALATKEFASQQTLEQAQASRDQAVAGVANAKAAVEAAQANVEVLKAQQQEASRTLKELQTAEAKAERDLSFTEIRAPIDGVLGNRAMQVGDYVQPGQRLAALVPLNNVYIDANFKETQLQGLRPGQPVTVSVDALPDHDIKGTVASVSPASGSVFSLLPPDNATGNFTKIVQRLAVRIKLPEDVMDKRLLRPGMSVIVNVNTKPTALASNPLSFAAQAAESSNVR